MQSCAETAVPRFVLHRRCVCALKHAQTACRWPAPRKAGCTQRRLLCLDRHNGGLAVTRPRAHGHSSELQRLTPPSISLRVALLLDGQTAVSAGERAPAASNGGAVVAGVGVKTAGSSQTALATCVLTSFAALRMSMAQRAATLSWALHSRQLPTFSVYAMRVAASSVLACCAAVSAGRVAMDAEGTAVASHTAAAAVATLAKAATGAIRALQR